MHLVPTHIKQVPILIGAASELCAMRELRGQYTTDAKHYKKRKKHNELYYKRRTTDGYQTNRAIKTWAHFFLLKSLTTSGVIQNWIKQKQTLLDYCKVNENTFRMRCKELAELGLISICKASFNITLTSFEKAADILGIVYQGTIQIEYDTTIEGKQIFQYFVRAEDIRTNQYTQLEALHFKAKKNPLLWQILMGAIVTKEYTEKMLEQDALLFQVLFLKLQQTTFRHGSEFYQEIHTLRADINRSTKKIKADHNYKARQSVSYMTGRMREFTIINTAKVYTVSVKAMHKYMPGEGPRKELTRYNKEKNQTRWNLTNQITLNYQSNAPKSKKIETKQAA